MFCFVSLALHEYMGCSPYWLGSSFLEDPCRECVHVHAVDCCAACAISLCMLFIMNRSARDIKIFADRLCGHRCVKEYLCPECRVGLLSHILTVQSSLDRLSDTGPQGEACGHTSACVSRRSGYKSQSQICRRFAPVSSGQAVIRARRKRRAFA